MDAEDIMECKCFVVFCVANNGSFYVDRVYRSTEMAKKRIEYLNLISNGRGEWRMILSELGE